MEVVSLILNDKKELLREEREGPRQVKKAAQDHTYKAQHSMSLLENYKHEAK